MFANVTRFLISTYPIWGIWTLAQVAHFSADGIFVPHLHTVFLIFLTDGKDRKRIGIENGKVSRTRGRWEISQLTTLQEDWRKYACLVRGRKWSQRYKFLNQCRKETKKWLRLVAIRGLLPMLLPQLVEIKIQISIKILWFWLRWNYSSNHWSIWLLKC